MRIKGITFALILSAALASKLWATTYHVTINTAAWQGQQGALLFAFNTAASQTNLNSISSEYAQLSDIYTIANFTHNGVLGTTRTRGGAIEGSLLWQSNPAANTSINADLWYWNASQGIFYFVDRAAYSELMVCFAPPEVGQTSPHVGSSIAFDIVLANNPKMVGSTSGLINDELAMYWLDARLTNPIATGDPSGSNALLTIEPPIYDGTGQTPTDWSVSTYLPAIYTPGNNQTPGSISITLPTPPDLTPPASITDLTIASYGRKSVSLTWSAPGDDGAVGTAYAFDLRYSGSPILTEAAFAAATPLTAGVPVPGPSGTYECALFDNILCGNRYFAVRTVDEAGNWSGVSNNPSVVIPCTGTILAADCGGALLVQSGQTNEWITQANLASGGIPTDTDELIPLGVDLIDGRPMEARILVAGAIQAEIKRMELGTVALGAGEALVSSGDTLCAGTYVTMASVIGATGQKVMPSGASSAGATFEFDADRPIELQLGSGKEVGAIVLKAEETPSSVDSQLRSILVEEWIDDEWHESQDIESIRSGRTFAVRVNAAPRYRVRALGSARGQVIGCMSNVRPVYPTWFSAVTKRNAHFGVVSKRTSAINNLRDGDELLLRAEVNSDEAAARRQLVMLVHANVSPATLIEKPEQTAIAWENSLGRIGPNPAISDVSLAFTVARTSNVRLRIYDVSGRLVRTLFEGAHQPGADQVVWQRIDGKGAQVGSGVYFCRLEIDGWRAGAKIVVVQK